MSPANLPVVYLIAQPTIARTKKPIVLDPLYNHGEVRVVVPAGTMPWKDPEKWFQIVEDKLATFDPARDFLVWAGGDTLTAVMVGMALINFSEPIWKFNWLRYERKRLPDGSRTDEGAEYVPVTIDLESGEEYEYEDEYDDDEGFPTLGDFQDESP